MKLLAEISEGSLGLSDQYEKLGESYRLRKSARAILFNSEGCIATQHLTVYNFHKLPGGGVEAGELIEDALRREVREEVGCEIEIVHPVGMTIEYRNKYRLIHLSYCYVANVLGEIGIPNLDTAEIKEGQETLWLLPLEVLERMKSDKPVKFESYFILKREISFLEEYARLLKE